MAHKAPRPCRFPGCPNTTITEDGYCPTHRKLLYKKHRMRKEVATMQHLYDTRWHKARKAFLNEHPLCVRCLLSNITTPATMVDHKTPHRGDYGLFWDISNWQALCDTCHRIKTASMDDDNVFGNVPKDKEDVDDVGGLVY